MRVRALMIRIVRQFLHDKRTLALLVFAPLFVLTLMYLVFHGDSTRVKLGGVSLPPLIAAAISKQEADLIPYSSRDEAETALSEGNIDAFMALADGTMHIKLEGSDPTKNRAIVMLVQKVMQDIIQAATPSAIPASPVFEYVHGSPDMSTFDTFSPVLIGLFAFFFVFLIAGISFLKERTSGTLERLLASPLKRWEIVAGYTVGFGIFTSLQAILIAGFTIKVLGSYMAGSFACVVLVMLLLSLTALSFGTFLSAFASTEFQMIQFIPIVIVPQVFFSGLFDLESISPWLGWISNITPLKYGADALRNVMIRGEGWSAIAADVCVLAGLSLVFMLLNVLALRKHRTI